MLQVDFRQDRPAVRARRPPRRARPTAQAQLNGGLQRQQAQMGGTRVNSQMVQIRIFDIFVAVAESSCVILSPCACSL